MTATGEPRLADRRVSAALPAQIDAIWQCLDNVPDPEIPVISLVDLGIIRKIEWNGGTLEVTVTPTYSGCPATAVINFEIEKALTGFGIDSLKLIRQLSPAWTTDWLSDRGRARLKAYGIAPPVNGTAACGAGRSAPPDIACPRCDSHRTERVSQFGSTPCKASWRCLDCLEPFDYFKCI